MKTIQSSLCAAALMLLTACASEPLTDEQFWFDQGERFGANGHDIDNRFLPNIKERVPFVEPAYQAGYEAGLAQYCSPDHAFEKGIKGIQYTGQCDHMEQKVRIKAEWQRGWDAFVGGFDIKIR